METKDFIIELEKKDMKLWLNEEGGLAFKGPKSNKGTERGNS